VEYTKITPYYLTFPEFRFDPNTKLADRKENQNCLGGGKYCARPFYSEEDFSPKAVLQENILQKCIWEETSPMNRTDLYFKYMETFYFKCYKVIDPDTKKPKFDIECGKAAMEYAKINPKPIEKCYAQSFILPSDMSPASIINNKELLDNRIFDNDNRKTKEMNVKIMPSIFINGKQFWGNFEKKAVLEAICSGLLKKPEICYNEGLFLKPSNTRNFWKFFLVVIALVLGISLIIFIICKKYMTQEVSDKLSESDIDLKVNTVVTSYLALKDQK
jgi:hypothetical protein